MVKKQPMRATVDLDSVTYICPCGASVTGEGQVITDFVRHHKPHSNGKVEEFISDDGMRCLHSDTPRQRTFKIGKK